MTQHRRGLNALGLGAAACAACCAGPILAFVGGTGVLGAFSTFVIGWIGLLVAATIAAFVIMRRRRTACEQPATTVAIPIPSRRTAQTTEAR